MDGGLAGEQVVVLVILGHREVEVAWDALVLLKLQLCPLPVVYELLQGLLKVVEYPLLRALYLGMVDGNLNLQFLRRYRGGITAYEPTRQ